MAIVPPKTAEPSSALVLFSSSQDSTTCLAGALSCRERVETIGFAYGHRLIAAMEVREPGRRGIARCPPTGAAGWGRRLREVRCQPAVGCRLPRLPRQ
ncbi:7-cyano-7-deazaguanine synthase [Reyranella sp.]|uniref:7-cyano-7-deazaguanine synthase n=1 Tax=Reyranella sp. TaxID=1929291 RepID=UPI003BA9EB07